MSEIPRESHREEWARAYDSSSSFEGGVHEHAALWNGLYRKARVPGETFRRAFEKGRRWKLPGA